MSRILAPQLGGKAPAPQSTRAQAPTVSRRAYSIGYAWHRCSQLLTMVLSAPVTLLLGITVMAGVRPPPIALPDPRSDRLN